jgi:hypothetical protein
MRHNFDVFEKWPDGTSIWRACVSGEYDAQRKVHELAEHSENVFFAINITAGEPLPSRVAGSQTNAQIKTALKRIA